MLQYNEQYHLLSGIYFTFSNNLKEKSLHVGHSQQKIDKMKMFLSYKKYETTSKQNFIIINLYTMLLNNITSQHQLMETISNYTDQELKDIYSWKHKIQNFRLHLSKDITHINEKCGGRTDYQSIIQMFRRKEIMFYTCWYYGVYTGINMNEVLKSRRFGKIMKKIQCLLLYISFDEKILQNIKTAFKDSLL